MNKSIIIKAAIFFIIATSIYNISNNVLADTNQKNNMIMVEGPVTGGNGKMFSATVADISKYGYSEKEYFFEGDADAYKLKGDMSMDGKWSLEKVSKAHFKTRMIVRRPVDIKKFNGTVVIEWLNVSAGADGDPGFMYNAQEIMREGYAWVGVSAQAVGVQGGGFAMMQGVPPLKKYDTERYGSLDHPGDTYSYDIYTQAARVVKGTGNIDVMEGLKPEYLIAYGESQSAMRLVSYVNGVHPIAEIFDGFFIHSRFSSGTPFENSSNMQMFSSKSAHIREDIKAKVFQFETEGDVFGMMSASGFYTARQPDTDTIRTWEVAGTAHADSYILDFNKPAGQEFSISSMMPCKDINEGPQQYVVRAALHALNIWVTKGVKPAISEPLRTDESGKPVTDEHGNTLGGVRTPDVDVPVSTLKGQRESGDAGMANMMCGMFGQTIEFTPEKLLELYPTHDDYIKKVRKSAERARESGFILGYDENIIIKKAQASSVPN